MAFLGDFIDAGDAVRGADDAAVLRRVRAMIDAGAAVAVMGNHELNAILYHTTGTDGLALRARSARNRAQHRSFVAAFGDATPAARGWTDWFLTLPLWLDLGGIRLVHACWSQPDIDIVAARRPDGRLHPEDLPEIAARKSAFARSVDRLVTGPEIALPPAHNFLDKGGHHRDRVRIAWWRSGAETWRAAALSVPDPAELPEGDLPKEQGIAFYPRGAKPVLVGHYKMQGTPIVETESVACLDYPDTPCVYRWRGERSLRQGNLLVVDPAESSAP